VLSLCAEEVVLKLPISSADPVGSIYFGRVALDDLWHRTVADHKGALTVRPLHLLSGEHHLVLFVDVVTGVGAQQQQSRAVITGSIAPDGLCKELWLHFEDQALPAAGV
jgi:hypothetical protein